MLRAALTASLSWAINGILQKAVGAGPGILSSLVCLFLLIMGLIGNSFTPKALFTGSWQKAHSFFQRRKQRYTSRAKTWARTQRQSPGIQSLLSLSGLV